MQARINIDYHIAFDGNWYSVPYGLTGEFEDARTTSATVEIFHRGKRVSSHLRNRGQNQNVTQAEHRPKSPQAPLEWTPSRMVQWAGTAGRSAHGALADRQLTWRQNEAMQARRRRTAWVHRQSSAMTACSSVE